MLKRLALSGALVVAAGAAVFWWLSQPSRLTAEDLPTHSPNLENGARLFWAGGCASCHAAPDAKDAAKLLLTGGVELKTPFGTFRAPNISPHPQAGIGDWTALDFVNAMVRGVAPDGRHYYPAFPYTYYQRMRLEDLLDLKAFLDRLPATDNRVADHDLRFPFGIRRGLGLWKRLYLDQEPFRPDPAEPEAVELGRYLVQGPGHCGACHTARDRFGGARGDRYLAGAVSPEVDEKAPGRPGRIPNITPHADGIGAWSAQDIAYALETGFTPEFDSFGGSMVAVQQNMAELSTEDRDAIAAYLKSIPPLPSEKP